MSISEEDFKEAIENLQKERKLEKKRPYNVHYCHVGPDRQVLIKTRIQGGNTGRSVEVYLTAKGYKVIVPQTDIAETFKENELDLVIECVRRLLETPLSNR